MDGLDFYSWFWDNFFQRKVKERAKESKKILIKEWYNIVFCMKKVRVRYLMKKLQRENDEIFKKDVDLAFSSLLYWFRDKFF